MQDKKKKTMHLLILEVDCRFDSHKFPLLKQLGLKRSNVIWTFYS